VLRRLALEAQLTKTANVEGAAAFAALVPVRRRGAVVCAHVAFQTMIDYLDTLSEQPNDDPGMNGRQLHQAVLEALDHTARHADYYAHQTRSDDGGYLRELVRTFRSATGALPSYPNVAATAHGLAQQLVCYQSFNLREDCGGHRKLAAWARHEIPSASGLSWWEAAAGLGSTLGIHALISAAASPDLEPADGAAIGKAYRPWVESLHCLLDSVLDESEDAAAGQRSLLDYYSSPEEAAERLGVITREAMRSISTLPTPRHHMIILAGMVGSYLSPPPSTPIGLGASKAVLGTVGPLAKPTALVFRIKRVIGLNSARREEKATGADPQPRQSPIAVQNRGSHP
jgi:tetraprenyl-beta-curcumene synthase